MFFYFQLSLDLYVIVAAPYFKTVVRQVSFTLLMTRYCDSNPPPPAREDPQVQTFSSRTRSSDRWCETTLYGPEL